MPSPKNVAAPRTKAPSSTARGGRGRPPKKAFINVLVRTTTRSSLTQMKSLLGLLSQGEVIDFLVENADKRPRSTPTEGR